MTLANDIIAFTNKTDQQSREWIGKQAYDPEKDGFFNLVFQGTRRTGIRSRYFDLQAVVPKIRKSMRFQLDDDVTNAVLKMSDSDDKTLLKAFEYARLPYPSIWVEYKKGEAIYGHLIESDAESLKIKFQTFVGSPRNEFHPESFQMADTIEEKGFRSSGTASGFGPFTDLTANMLHRVSDLIASNKKRSDANTTHRLILSALLLMNSRSSVIKADPPKHSILGRKKKTVDGKPLKISIQPVKFDLNRVLKTRRNLSDKQAAKICAEALVKGHFKVRKTGVFWWSPHVRNRRKGVGQETVIKQQLDKDRHVKSSKPGEVLFLPTENNL